MARTIIKPCFWSCIVVYWTCTIDYVKLPLYYHLIPLVYHDKTLVFFVRGLKKHEVFLVHVHHHATGREVSQSKHGYSISLQLNCTGCRKSSDEVISCHWCNLRCSLFPLGKLWGNIKRRICLCKAIFHKDLMLN